MAKEFNKLAPERVEKRAAKAIEAMPLDELPGLAAQINSEHAAVENTLRAGLAHALHAGELLIAAKQLVPHGGWLPWLTANCEVSERTAQGYMRLVAHRAKLETKSATRCGFEDLTLRQGLKLLAEPEATSPSASPRMESSEWWEKKLNPNSRFIPPPHSILYGQHGGTTLFIAHSEEHPGYCFVVRLEYSGSKDSGSKDSGSFVETSRRPIHAPAVEVTLTERMALRPELFEWEELPCPPWLENVWWIEGAG